MLEKFFDGEADITGDLTEEYRGDVSTSMARNRGSPSIIMAKLFMASLLACLHKTETFEDTDDFRGFQYGAGSHRQTTTTLWVPINSVSNSGSPSSSSNSTTSLRL